MTQKRVTELVFVVCLLVLTGVAGVLALGYSPRGRLYPLIVIIALLVLLLMKLAALIGPKAAARLEVHGIDMPDQIISETNVMPESKWRLEVKIIAWLVLLFFLILLFGFLITIPIFLLLFIKFQGRHGWKLSILCSLAVFAFIYTMFVAILSVSFPPGLLFA